MRRGFSHSSKHIYNALGQLIRVNDPHENATWVYNYDRGGNITSKVKYAYTTGTLGAAVETIPHAYGDANWKDKLTAYNGTAITYDATGNPLNDGSWTYEWAVGRQLKKMSRDGQSLTFKYDHNGMHIQKVHEHSWYPETTNYTYHGKLLTHMTVNYTDFDEVEHTDNLHFFYDAYSHPAKVRFNDELYTYLGNTKNDIVGILDSTGNLVVEYKYDAWGKPLSTTGSLADTLGARNPFRYRGYVYDEESGLYYLRSRFYSSGWRRFMNADGCFGALSRLHSLNLFLYCCNAVITAVDDTGRSPRGIMGPIIGGRRKTINSSSNELPEYINPLRDFGLAKDTNCPRIRQKFYLYDMDSDTAKKISDQKSSDTTISMSVFSSIFGILGLWIPFKPIGAAYNETAVAYTAYESRYSTYVTEQPYRVNIGVYDASAIRPGMIYVLINVDADDDTALHLGWDVYGMQSEDFYFEEAYKEALCLDIID